MEWMREALCRHKNADLWYPPLESSTPNDYYTVAKLVCHRCPVWAQCLAVSKSETWGMWGGLTPQERSGTVKMQCGTVEMYRKGCRCHQCREASVKVPNRADLSLIPSQGEPFDVKALLFTLIGG